uniref:DBF4-type domain-containing protein n=1 Tax=Leptobrachium leishanense TaxID=445787 RepID=A0A8C5WHV8_9ANUR
MADLDSIQTGKKGRLEHSVPAVKKQKFRCLSFSGKSFYLDLPPNKHTQVLTKAITKLGGVIESFLSRDVNYVVTGNKKVTGPASKDSTSAKGGARDTQCKTTTTGIESTHCSRGKQLLKKVIQSQECNSVLASARSWGVTIVHVDDILEYIEFLENRRTKIRATKGKGENCTKASRKVAKLKSPFLKIEDQSKKYRPIHCMFSSFPEVSFEPSDRGPFETVQTRNSTCRGKDPGDQAEDDGERIPQAHKRKGYCECCEKMYSVLSEHLGGELHQRFASIPSNFTVIEKLVTKLAFDFAELSHGITSAEDCGSGQEIVDAQGCERQNVELEETVEYMDTLETKTALEGDCSEWIADYYVGCGVVSEAPVQLNQEAEEFVGQELGVAVTQPAEPTAQTMEFTSTSVEFHVSPSLETVKSSKLPLALTDFLSPVLSLIAVSVGDLPAVEAAQNLCDQSLLAEMTTIQLQDDRIVHTQPQTDIMAEGTTDQSKETLFCAVELSKSWGPGQLGLPIFYHNVQQTPFSSIKPLILPPLRCGEFVVPFAPVTQTPPGQETLVSRTHCRRTKRKFSGSPYPPPAKRTLERLRTALGQTIAFPMWGDNHQIAIPNWADWTRWDCTEVTDVSSPHHFPCFKPKMTPDSPSSELDWDAPIAPHREPHQQTENYGHLRTAQIDLDESWYMKHLCSVLTGSHAPITAQRVAVTPTL